MAISRIRDSIILYDHGCVEGAFISILIAVAATARKRYPKSQFKDNESFKRFVTDEMAKITGGATGVKFYCDGKYDVPLEDILYNILRCTLVHEGTMPHALRFTDPRIFEGTISNVVDVNYDPIGIPKGWIWNFARVVMNAPENSAEFNQHDLQLPENYPENAPILLDWPDNDPKRAGVPGIENVKNI